MKIKITSQESELEGKLEKAIVKPFGTSAHIVMPKKHFGKIVNVIIPDEPKYVWLLSDAELKEIVKICTDIVIKENGRLESLKLTTINNLRKPEFDLIDLLKVVDILKRSPNHQHLIKKIKEFYNL